MSTVTPERAASSAPRGVIKASRYDELVDRLAETVPAGMRAREWAAGYSVVSVEFASGDLLALRHFPHSALGPFTSVWHQSVDGAWRLYVDSAGPHCGCQRYFGSALMDSEPVSIELEWTTERVLVIRASKRHMIELEWVVELGSSLRTSMMNAAGRLVPDIVARRPAALEALGAVATRLLGMGAWRMTGTAPNGQRFYFVPARVAPVAGSRATLNGRDLGATVEPQRIVRLGDYVLPRRPLFAVGRAVFDDPRASGRPPQPPDEGDGWGEQGALLGKYVCHRVVGRVMEAARHGTFGGDRSYAVVMFVDIAGFSTLAERFEPERVMAILNRNLEVVVDTIFRYDGAVLKFLGDGLLAAFGIHERREDDLGRASTCALEIQANVEAAQALMPEEERVSVAIGLHSGDVVCGNIGHRDRLDFTIIGDTVNVAARVQALAHGGEVLLTGTMADAIARDFELEQGECTTVAGREEAVRIDRLIAPRG